MDCRGFKLDLDRVEVGTGSFTFGSFNASPFSFLSLGESLSVDSQKLFGSSLTFNSQSYAASSYFQLD